MENKDIKEIKITYADGSEKIVSRGVCFLEHCPNL